MQAGNGISEADMCSSGMFEGQTQVKVAAIIGCCCGRHTVTSSTPESRIAIAQDDTASVLGFKFLMSGCIETIDFACVNLAGMLARQWHDWDEIIKRLVPVELQVAVGCALEELPTCLSFAGGWALNWHCLAWTLHGCACSNHPLGDVFALLLEPAAAAAACASSTHVPFACNPSICQCQRQVSAHKTIQHAVAEYCCLQYALISSIIERTGSIRNAQVQQPTAM